SPAFLMLASAGLVGARASGRRPLQALHFPTGVKAFGTAAAAVVAAAWSAQHYIPRLHSALTGGQTPHDLAVFLHAASKLVHLDSPYAFRGDETYAYPPLLGFLAAPLHAVGPTAATVAWMLCCLAAVGVALWLLGVRDWRCYALSVAFPFTTSAVDLGTVAPFLLVAVGGRSAARHRRLDRARRASSAVQPGFRHAHARTGRGARGVADPLDPLLPPAARPDRSRSPAPQPSLVRPVRLLPARGNGVANRRRPQARAGTRDHACDPCGESSTRPASGRASRSACRRASLASVGRQVTDSRALALAGGSAMRLGFHTKQLTERGTEVALFDYALAANQTLGHDVTVFVPAETAKIIPGVKRRFEEHFELVLYSTPRDIACDALYVIK